MRVQGAAGRAERDPGIHQESVHHREPAEPDRLPGVPGSGERDQPVSEQQQDFGAGVARLRRPAQPPLPGPERQPAGGHPPGGLHRPEPVPAGAQPEPGPLQPLGGGGPGHLAALELPGDPEGAGPVQQRPGLPAAAHLLPPEQPAAPPAGQQLPGGAAQLHAVGPGAAGGAGPAPQRPEDGGRGGPAGAGLGARRRPPAGQKPLRVQVRNRTVGAVAEPLAGPHPGRRGAGVRLPGRHEEHLPAGGGRTGPGLPPGGRGGPPGPAHLLRLPGNRPGLRRPRLPLCAVPQPQGHQEARLRPAGHLPGGVGGLPLPLRGRLGPPAGAGGRHLTAPSRALM